MTPKYKVVSVVYNTSLLVNNLKFTRVIYEFRAVAYHLGIKSLHLDEKINQFKLNESIYH